MIVNGLFVLDIVRRFRTGIYREEHNDTLMRPKRVAKYKH